jgi:catechol 2,3-dioxygenase-like lactoylglutathione lyase family enzyme
MASTVPRRKDALAVHSLQRFVFSVPDLAEAVKFYRTFGLDVREVDGRLDLYAFGHPHRWASIYGRPGGKRLEYIALGAYTEDYESIVARLSKLGVPTSAPHPLADDEGVWITDPEGIAVEIVRADKVSPSGRRDPVPERVNGKAAAPARSKAPPTRPRHLSHILMFTSDVMRSVAFYRDVLGLRLSDHSGDIIAFMHGAHGSDHHMLAFAKSDGPGLHHSSWDVPTIDAVGVGMEQMAAAGYNEGWGVGRHVIGSNYFRYIRDPWGSFAEYSADIDYIPADVEWPVADHPPEDSFYVWGPPVPDYFIQNHETAVRASK